MFLRSLSRLGMSITPLRRRSNCCCKSSNSWSDKFSKSIRLLWGTAHAVDEFIKLQVDGLGITILSILDEKHDPKSHNGRTGINNELSRI
jgi:hypothetical protein